MRAWPVVDVETRNKIKERKEMQLMADFGLSEKSAAVLRCVMWHPGMTNAEVADDLEMQPRSVSGVVNGLVKKGLVEKDAKGRLTAAGKDKGEME